MKYLIAIFLTLSLMACDQQSNYLDGYVGIWHGERKDSWSGKLKEEVFEIQKNDQTYVLIGDLLKENQETLALSESDQQLVLKTQVGELALALIDDRNGLLFNETSYTRIDKNKVAEIKNDIEEKERLAEEKKDEERRQKQKNEEERNLKIAKDKAEFAEKERIFRSECEKIGSEHKKAMHPYAVKFQNEKDWNKRSEIMNQSKEVNISFMKRVEELNNSTKVKLYCRSVSSGYAIQSFL